MVVNMYKHG